MVVLLLRLLWSLLLHPPLRLQLRLLLLKDELLPLLVEGLPGQQSLAELCEAPTGPRYREIQGDMREIQGDTRKI